MSDILDDLKDLEKQATAERSHYYVAACTRRAVSEIGELRERMRMLDKIVERWALAFMQIRTMQGNPIEIARKAMDTCDDEQDVNK